MTVIDKVATPYIIKQRLLNRVLVIKPGVAATDEPAVELKTFVKARMARHEDPHEIPFADDLQKTATGNIQRFKLREPALDA
jgi:acyl-coenzyme A synthetase/AMP-(fatty) acid ligase